MSTDGSGRVSTGVAGFDQILHGGLLPGRSYMVRGDSGAGKTILGYHYLTASDDDGLYVALEETAGDVVRNAEALGFDLDVEILDLSPEEDRFLAEDPYDVFAPEEVERDELVRRIADAVTEDPPDRVFIDPLTQLRHLAPDDYQFRQEVTAMMRFFKSRGATVLFTTQPTPNAPDDDMQFLADGSLELRRTENGRTAAVTKHRGSDFQSGRHAMRIGGDGLHVYPRLIPDTHQQEFERDVLSSGVDELDDLLGGGIERGTVTVVSGPSGVGKSTTAAHFAKEAAARGERSAVYLFEESEASFRYRSRNVGVPVDEMAEADRLHLEAIEPLALSASEFAHRVRREVEQREARLVVLDGTSGYRLSLHDDSTDVVTELHALCRYLRNVGVTVVLTEEIHEVTGSFRATSERISYIADNILFLRYLEYRGEMRKAFGVLKKRLGDFEPTLRAFRITADGLVVGEPLEELRGVLSGAPEWEDD